MKLPETLFVRVEKPENDEPYLVADRDINDTAELGESRKVGVYRLQKIVTVTTEVKAR